MEETWKEKPREKEGICTSIFKVWERMKRTENDRGEEMQWE
jgi:hypothetical protein